MKNKIEWYNRKNKLLIRIIGKKNVDLVLRIMYEEEKN